MNWPTTLLVTVIGALLGSGITVFAQWFQALNLRKKLVLNACAELIETHIRPVEQPMSGFDVILSDPVMFVHAARLLDLIPLGLKKDREALSALTALRRDTESFNHHCRQTYRIVAQPFHPGLQGTFLSATEALNLATIAVNTDLEHALAALRKRHPFWTRNLRSP